MLTDFMIGPSILMYHSVDDHSVDEYAVSVGAFRDQMRWLSENGFEVISLEYLLRSIQANKHKQLRKKVVITFDDGYKDFINNALPILQDYKAPATVFIVTGMLGEKAKWNETATNTQLMNEDEIRYIKEQGISLGSHTCNHARLTTLNNDDILRELRDSKEYLESLGETFYSLSYPWGQWSPQIVDAVNKSGYACAVTATGQMRLSTVNTYLLPRIGLHRNMTLKLFRIKLTRTPIEIEFRRRCRVMITRGLGRFIKN